MPQNSLPGAKLAVQLISPAKLKFDLRDCSLHWNDWNKPSPISSCQVCCRVGNLRQMDGVDSKEMVMSYIPQLYSLGYICQYPTPTESASHFFTFKISTKEDTPKNKSTYMKIADSVEPKERKTFSQKTMSTTKSCSMTCAKVFVQLPQRLRNRWRLLGYVEPGSSFKTWM